MKCDKCFFCCNIGKGIYADYPVKYCRRTTEYKLPFVETQDGKMRQLDFNNYKDCMIWHNVGCNIHPKTIEKAKREYFKRYEELGEKYEQDREG